MRTSFTIAILLLAFIGAKSQDFYLSPAYYPTQGEISKEWRATPPTIGLSGYLSESPTAKYGSALPTWWERHRKGFAVSGIQLLSITLDAVGDAVYDMGKERGNKPQMTWGHTLQATAVGSAFLLIPMVDWERPVGDGVKMAISYVLMRYAMFDLGYNLTRGWDPLYADGWKAKMPPDGRVFTGVIFLGVSLTINFTEF